MKILFICCLTPYFPSFSLCLERAKSFTNLQKSNSALKLFKKGAVKVVINNLEKKEVQWKKEIIRDVSKFSRDELRCIRLRKYLNILPSYDPVKTSFFDMFKTKKLERLKSYRSIAYELIEEINDYENTKEITKAKDVLAELREAKKEYFERFMIDWLDNSGMDREYKVKMIKEKWKIEDHLYKIANKINNLTRIKRSNFAKLEQIVVQILNNEDNINSLLVEIKEFKATRASVKYLQTLEDYNNTVNESDLIRISDQMPGLLEELKDALEKLDNTVAMKSSFKSLSSYYATDNMDNKRFENILTNSTSFVESLEKKRDDTIDKIISIIEEKKEEDITNLKNKQLFMEYQKILNETIKIKKKSKNICYYCFFICSSFI